MFRRFALTWSCVLLATAVKAVTPDVLQEDVTTLDQAGFNSKKAKTVAAVSTDIAHRVAMDLFEERHERLLRRIEQLEEDVGIGEHAVEIEDGKKGTLIDALDKNKIDVLKPGQIATGATVVGALAAVVGALTGVVLGRRRI